MATSIDHGAFQNCVSLISVSFPLVTSIGGSAFWYCTSLESVSSPLVTSIGGTPFSGCRSLTTITLGGNPPTVGINNLTGITNVNPPGGLNITVRIPTGSYSNYGLPSNLDFNNADTTNNWGNAFRGIGWDGTNYLTGVSVNTNVRLTFVEYTP